MILILSRESAEITTDTVIDWLENLGSDYFRLNGEDLVNEKCSIDFSLNNSTNEWRFTIFYENQRIDSEDINAIWFRRSFDWDIDRRYWSDSNNIAETDFLNNLNSYHQGEIRAAYNLIETVLKSRFWLSRPSKSAMDKFEVLSEARKCGFHIPESLLTNNLRGLNCFVNKHVSCITKPSVDATVLIGSDFGISTMTKKINAEIVSKVRSPFFAPSFFQVQIDKVYEIRVIFLQERIFPVAIFSQSNPKTILDYRNYDEKIPNRLELLKLSEGLSKKILKLVKSLDLNFGCIDLIKSRAGDYVFLEVNPVGQFLGHSGILNLQIEKYIAKILIQNDEIQKVQRV